MIQLERRQQFLVILLVGVILFGGYRLAQMKERAAENNKPVLEQEEIKENDGIKVHVAGGLPGRGLPTAPGFQDY